MSTKEDSGPNARGLVTVAIAAYNSSRTIVETVESVLAQTWPAIDVMVVDDGSTDDTVERLEPFGDRIRIVRKPNGGIGSNRNAGFAAARGEYVALMDGDDVCDPDRVAIQVQVFTRHPEVVLCATDFTAFDEQGRISASHGAAYYSVIAEAPRGLDSFYPVRETMEVAPGTWPSLRSPLRVELGIGSVYPDLAFGNFVHPPTVMFRKSVLECSGKADESLLTCDWELFVRMARCGAFAHAHRALHHYRIHQHQVSSQRTSGGRMPLDVVRAADKIFAADPALAASAPDRLRRKTREYCFDAAYVLAGSRKGLALRMLVRSLLNGGLSPAAAKTAVRIALPERLVAAIRRRLAA